MSSVKNFEEWRAEEIAKVFLLKSSLNLLISDYPTPLFDLFIQLVDHPNIKFAIEVKTKSKFNSQINLQLRSLKKYRDSNVIDIPVLIFKIDERNEVGELDFLIIPSIIGKKLLIRHTFKFVPLNKNSLIKKIDIIRRWYSNR